MKYFNQAKSRARPIIHEHTIDEKKKNNNNDCGKYCNYSLLKLFSTTVHHSSACIAFTPWTILCTRIIVYDNRLLSFTAVTVRVDFFRALSLRAFCENLKSTIENQSFENFDFKLFLQSIGVQFTRKVCNT